LNKRRRNKNILKFKLISRIWKCWKEMGVFEISLMRINILKSVTIWIHTILNWIKIIFHLKSYQEIIKIWDNLNQFLIIFFSIGKLIYLCKKKRLKKINNLIFSKNKMDWITWPKPIKQFYLILIKDICKMKSDLKYPNSNDFI
jgi:hypothetical protein